MPNRQTITQMCRVAGGGGGGAAATAAAAVGGGGMTLSGRGPRE